jgi:hypothetical protein
MLCFMVRFGLIALMVAAIGGVIWGFQPNRMSSLAWIVLGVAAIYGLLSAVLPERMLKRRINRREPLSFDEIYRTSFRELPYPRNLVEEVWNELARDLGLDAGKLRPTDRFGVELSVKSFPLVDLSETVNARLTERLRKNKAAPSETEKKASTINTVCDYVEFACRIELQKQQA